MTAYIVFCRHSGDRYWWICQIDPKPVKDNELTGVRTPAQFDTLEEAKQFMKDRQDLPMDYYAVGIPLPE